jgi:hypothetical protein
MAGFPRDLSPTWMAQASSRVLRVLRARAPFEFALQFAQPAQFAMELLNHEAHHPHGFMKPVTYFFLYRS